MKWPTPEHGPIKAKYSNRQLKRCVISRADDWKTLGSAATRKNSKHSTPTSATVSTPAIKQSKNTMNSASNNEKENHESKDSDEEKTPRTGTRMVGHTRSRVPGDSGKKEFGSMNALLRKSVPGKPNPMRKQQ